MNITEGLSCAFQQQVVAIDPEKSSYIPLGEVRKSIVVTPNIQAAFPSEQS